MVCVIVWYVLVRYLLLHYRKGTIAVVLKKTKEKHTSSVKPLYPGECNAVGTFPEGYPT